MDVGFLVYVAVLLASGALLLVLAGFGFGNRAINGLIGLAAVGPNPYTLQQPERPPS